MPQDISAAVLFLASPEADYITGTDIIVDGGFTRVVAWVRSWGNSPDFTPAPKAR